MASSLDQAGPCTRTVLDSALLHSLIGGHDVMDSTSLSAPVPPVVEAARRADVSGMRIGIIKELTGAGFQPGVQARFEEAVQHLVDAGAEVVEVSCSSFSYALAAYYLVMPSEVSSNLAKFDAMRYGLRVLPEGIDDPSAEQVMAASRGAGFGDEVKRRIILGTYALSSGYYDAYYGSAQKVRTLIANDFAAAFEQADVLVSPTSPTTAFPFGDKMNDPLSMYMQDIATIPANLAGVPGMSLPSGLADEDGLPAGFQILAPSMKDERMYAVGAALEKRLLAAWGGPLLARVPDLTAAADATTKEA
jgi:aspartyl-tRNA(Asn)/glutamyl-tRNA(Gln) amidotransferase subunit A